MEGVVIPMVVYYNDSLFNEYDYPVQGLAIVNSDRLIGDVVGVVIEKVLMEIGVTAHNKMAEILGNYNMTFSDCYKKPSIINYALKQIFGDAYLSPVEKIRNELMGLDDDKKIKAFIALISSA